MGNQDIRWEQRFQNFQKAFFNLKSAVDLHQERTLSDLETQGLIQAFEFTFELSWKVLKDYLQFMQVEVKFPRDVIKQAFQYELLDDGDVWMDMLEKRNLMVHTYDEKNAKRAVNLIIQSYFDQIHTLYQLFLSKKELQILIQSII